MSEAILGALLVQSAAGGALILVVLLLRRLLQGKVSRVLVYGMWLAVVLRMLIPIQLPFPIHFSARTDIPVRQARIVDQSPALPQVQNESAHSSKPADAPPVLAGGKDDMRQAAVPSKGAEAASPASPHPMALPSFLLALWLLGMAAVALHIIFVNRRWRRRALAGAIPLPAAAPVPVLLAAVPSPCLFGLIKPRILISRTGARPENLPYVLAHEVSHFRGMDHIWNALGKLMLAVFWFHPLVWLAERCARRDCECACDERAARSLGQEASFEYARTLISLVTPERGITAPSASFMAVNLPDMKRRMALILQPRRARRWACALFTGLILMSSALSFATGEKVVREITLPESFTQAPSYYPTQGGLWIAMDGRLYRQSGEDTYAQIAAAPSAAQIAVDDQAAYILRKDKNEIVVVDHQGAEQKAWALPGELTPLKLEIAGGKLAVLSGEASNPAAGRFASEGRLYLMDVQNGSMTEAKLGTVMDMSPDGAGNLLVLHAAVPGTDEALISRLDPKNLSSGTVTAAKPWTFGIAAERDACYLLTANGIWKFDEKARTFTRLILPGDMGTDAMRDMRVSGGTLYVWDQASSRLLSMDVSEGRSAGKTILTFINHGYHGGAFESAKEAFLARHPDVEFRDITMGTEEYTTALLAGDEGMDILVESAGVIWKYAKAGALLPLDSEPSITQALRMAEWMPFEDVYSYEDRLYGIPGHVLYDLWAVDASLAAQTGFMMPATPYTWRDVYEAASAAGLGKAGKPVLMYDYIGNPDVMYGYNMAQRQWEGVLNYDTPAFRDDMEAYRQMVREGIIVLTDPTAAEPAVPAMIETSADIGENTVMPPVVNGREAALMQSEGYFINARSQNRALAVEFLAELAKPEHQYRSSYGIAGTMLLMDAAKYNRDRYDDPDYGIGRYTQKMEALRLYTSGKWVSWSSYLNPAFFLAQTGAMPKYLEGSMSLDAFIRVIQSKVDMMQYE